MKREPKRYSRRFEVEVEINKLKRRAHAKLKEAEAIEDRAKALVKDSANPKYQGHEDQYFLEQADELRKNSRKLRRSATTMLETKVPNLGRTLAVLETATMPFLEDASVKLQNE